MSSLLRHAVLLGLAPLFWGLPLWLLFGATLCAQVPAHPPAVAGSNLPPVMAPPELPAAKSPVDLFREVLAMTKAERLQFLSNRPPESRKLILAKVREYEGLRPDQRELRLRVTELRWYLLPLMSVPATNRPASLAVVPPEERKLVEERLQAWDQVPAELRQQLLANEATIRYFTELAGSTEEQRQRLLENISPARRQKLEEGIKEWQQLPEDQRQKLMRQFNQFFELTPQEKQKALNTLSESERRQIEKTLRSFGRLPPAQRAQCIRSFEKFASLSLEERQQFLKNAERWKLMSPDERQAWRDLVDKLSLQPPLPPQLRLPRLPVPPPPLPRRPSAGPPTGAVATNQ